MCLSYLMFSWALRKHTFTDFFIGRIIQKMEMLHFLHHFNNMACRESTSFNYHPSQHQLVMYSSGLFVSSQQNVFLVTTFLAGELRQKQSEYFARC